MTQVLGISGLKGSGKTTTVQYLIEYHKYEMYEMAGPLKEGLKAIFGFTHEQLYDGHLKEEVDPFWQVSPRKTLQYVGTDLFRDQMDKLIPGLGNDFWVKRALKELPKYRFVVIDGIRFQNEVDMIHALGGKVIRLIRPGTESQDTHSSESSSLKGIDCFMVNAGELSDLYKALDQMLESLK